MSAGPEAAVIDPRLDVVGKPHLTLGQIRHRLREVAATGELIDALPVPPTTASRPAPHR
jgi:hypothetical protein